MGFDSNAIRFLLEARRAGVDFSTFVTLGRQTMVVPPDEFPWAFRHESTVPDDALVHTWVKNEGCGNDGYSDAFLRYLGARQLDFIDATDYEGATILHDLNRPAPPELFDRFSTVLDGGTIEHIFDAPTAVWNCLKMVREGGHFLAISPTNNFFGHSFYQFSPEFWWTVLSEANGFRVESMVAAEVRRHPRWFEVPNMRPSGRLLQFSSLWPMLLLVRARRIGAVPATPEAFDIQQSFYEHAWEDSEDSPAPGASAPPLIHRIKERLLRITTRCGIPESLLRPVSRKLRRLP